MPFSNIKYVDMILNYGESRGKVSQELRFIVRLATISKTENAWRLEANNSDTSHNGQHSQSQKEKELNSYEMTRKSVTGHLAAASRCIYTECNETVLDTTSAARAEAISQHARRVPLPPAMSIANSVSPTPRTSRSLRATYLQY
ncbi:hypothetical protein EVAR_80967_1 [Eumeta japonica]|uniref:Uncharacterized protein n=1 Tax=Eumeta variegata TaxID=151549 RepID=A0A4C1WNE6_EUMVA|nr:hypothetical protein EVAR_80967_1 [Eumeta japonica]